METPDGSQITKIGKNNQFEYIIILDVPATQCSHNQQAAPL